jgi:myo-inositol-1(or 4)-monophosphatase
MTTTKSHDLQEVLLVARRAAERASVIARQQRESLSVSVSFKDVRNLVTTADLACEKVIVDTIKEHYPDHTILAEESSSSVTPQACTSGPVWVIDPIDGTTNYAHGHFHVGISIGFAVDSVAQVGVVVAPFYGEVFSAVRGGGAYLNDTRIQVSKVSSIDDALVCTGFPYKRGNIKNICARLERVVTRCRDLRRLGAASLDISWVACGRLDAFYEETLNPWDVVAARLIAHEAGAVFGHFPYDCDSQKVSAAYSGDLFADNLIVAAPGCLRELSELLQG